ncbi:MAG: glycosyltransferase family 2 protein [Desulfovibrionaceae bacterium]|nr:glycosyltransferase family 2 protein [Desulfovibrionaceae bacterium]
MKFTLLIPVLNERESMEVVMPQFDTSLVDQVLFLDGGSTDGTVDYCREHGYEYYVQKEPGIRQAYTEALDLIRGDAVITISPDGNCRAQDLKPLIDEFTRGDYDMVIASRYFDGARSEDDDFITTFGNRLFTGTVNLLFGARYTDAMTIYRCYKKSLIYDLELNLDKWYAPFEKLFFTRLSWEPMLSARAAKRGLKIGETLGFEPARIAGERKLQIIRWGLGYYCQFIRDWLFWK